jgi:hypothetical protein
VSFDIPNGGGSLGATPGRTSVIPGVGTGLPPTIVGPQLSPPRVVRKTITRYELRGAPAWRTAPYWASTLGALLLLGALGFVFRRSRVVAPVAAAFDRFARQFIRG